MPDHKFITASVQTEDGYVQALMYQASGKLHVKPLGEQAIAFTPAGAQTLFNLMGMAYARGER